MFSTFVSKTYLYNKTNLLNNCRSLIPHFSKKVPFVSLFKISQRNLNLHEYQSKQLMREFNIRIQIGDIASTSEQASSIAQSIRDIDPTCDLIIKAQILAGGRGKGHFSTGFKGGVHICNSPEDIAVKAAAMLGHRLITKQTQSSGELVKKVLVNAGINFDREIYFAILIDRAECLPVIVASPAGGMNIEEISETNPELIFRRYIDPNIGVTSEDSRYVAQKLGFGPGMDAFGDIQIQIERLYNLFVKCDCIQVEINPLVLATNGQIFCVDAKLTFDDSAKFRQQILHSLAEPRISAMIDAEESGINYVKLPGSIGCMVNGAGLALATMDSIKLHGGNPANFLDLGGTAKEKQIKAGLRIILSDPDCEAILVNIFGGIVSCDTIARGIIDAIKRLGFQKPIIARLLGVKNEIGNQILESSGLNNIILASTLDEAAEFSVKAVQKKKN